MTLRVFLSDKAEVVDISDKAEVVDIYPRLARVKLELLVGLVALQTTRRRGGDFMTYFCTL